MSGETVIETERLVLRGWTHEDVPAVVDLFGHPDPDAEPALGVVRDCEGEPRGSSLAAGPEL